MFVDTLRGQMYTRWEWLRGIAWADGTIKPLSAQKFTGGN